MKFQQAMFITAAVTASSLIAPIYSDVAWPSAASIITASLIANQNGVTGRALPMIGSMLLLCSPAAKAEASDRNKIFGYDVQAAGNHNGVEQVKGQLQAVVPLGSNLKATGYAGIVAANGHTPQQYAGACVDGNVQLGKNVQFASYANLDAVKGSKPQQAAGAEMKVVVPLGNGGSVSGGAGVHAAKGSKPQQQWNIAYTHNF